MGRVNTGFSSSATLDSRLPEIAANLQRKVSGAVKQGAQLVADAAAANLVYGPPPHHLKDDIYVERVGAAEYRVLAGEKDTYYGHVRENGGVNEPPRPFLVPALEEKTPEVLSLVEAALR